MNLKNNILIILSIFAVVACTPKKQGGETASEETVAVSYDASAAKIKWTAFKFTERTGVSGTFNQVTVTPGTGSSIDSLLTDGSFVIETESVNSNEATRDPKIRKSFFGVFNTPQITGKILSAKDGSGEVELMMNDTTGTVPFTYVTTDSTVVLTTSVDVSNWNGAPAIDSLNSVCSELHTGSDGISKLWPDVVVQVTIPAKK